MAVVWASRYASVIICASCVISFKTLWLGIHQCKISWKLHLSGKAQDLKYWLTVRSAKHQKNLQPAKQGLFLLIPDAAVYINFAVNLARFSRTPILYYMDNHIQISQNSWESTFAGITSAQVFPCEFWKISKNTLFTEHLSFGRLHK